jgi:hypothetical protein
MQYKNVIKITFEELFYKHAFEQTTRIRENVYDCEPEEVIANLGRIKNELESMLCAGKDIAGKAVRDLFEVYQYDELLADDPDSAAVLKWMENDEEFVIIVEKDNEVLATIKG